MLGILRTSQVFDTFLHVACSPVVMQESTVNHDGVLRLGAAMNFRLRSNIQNKLLF